MVSLKRALGRYMVGILGVLGNCRVDGIFRNIGRTSCGLLCLALPFAGMLMAALSITPVQAQSVATTFRTGEHPGKTRFVLELSEKPEYTIFTLDEPYRIVIDFKGVDWQVAPSLHKRGQGVIKGIRNGSSGAGNHRVVLDLAGPALV